MASEDPSKLLIVNADDLGRTPGINEGIFEAHRRGVVSSATLMVNYPHSAPAARAAADHPHLGIGLHVALTGGPSALPATSIPSLVDDEGRLPRQPDRIGRPLLAEVEAEIRAQLERFEQMVGRPPTHLDTHHHSHRHPIVLEALIRVAAEAGLPVRRSSERVAERVQEAGLRTTDAFVEDFFDRAIDLRSFVSIVNGLPSGVTELMCHPARVDDELREHSTYADQRDLELETLCDPRARAALDDHGIRLVHFGDL